MLVDLSELSMRFLTWFKRGCRVGMIVWLYVYCTDCDVVCISCELMSCICLRGVGMFEVCMLESVSGGTRGTYLNWCFVDVVLWKVCKLCVPWYRLIKLSDGLKYVGMNLLRSLCMLTVLCALHYVEGYSECTCWWLKPVAMVLFILWLMKKNEQWNRSVWVCWFCLVLE